MNDNIRENRLSGWPLHTDREATAVMARVDDRLTYWLIMALAVLSIFQVYVYYSGQFCLSLCLIVAAVVAFRVDWIAVLRFKLGWLLLGLAVVQLVSMMWLVDIDYAWPDLTSFTLFCVSLAAGVHLGRRSGDSGLAILRITCWIGLTVALAIVVLRFIPETRSELLNTPEAHWLVEPYRLDRFFATPSDSMGGTSNGIDTAKSGAVFMNANVAGAWCGLMGFLSIGVYSGKSRPLGVLMALVYGAALVASGSKASLAIVVLAPLSIFVLLWARRLKDLRGLDGRVLAVIAAGLAVIVALVIFREPAMALLASHSTYVSQSIETSTCRVDIFHHAVQEFKQHPFLGNGYGGWNASFTAHTNNAFCLLGGVPPLNSIVLLWSHSGIAAAVLGIAIVFFMMRAYLGAARAGDVLSVFAACGFLCVFYQSMGEDISLFGDSHIAVPMAMTLGIVLAQRSLLRN